MHKSKNIYILSILLLFIGVFLDFTAVGVISKVLITIGAILTIYYSFISKKEAIKENEILNKDLLSLKNEIEPLNLEINTLKEKIINAKKTQEISRKYANDIQKSSGVKELVSGFIKNICIDLEASQGAFYLVNGNKLELDSGFAIEINDDIKSFELNEGLIGQVATDKKSMIIKDIPQDYINIKSGLGNAKPKQIIIQPIVFNNKVLGVFEIATFSNLSEDELSLLEMVSSNIAIKISSF